MFRAPATSSMESAISAITSTARVRLWPRESVTLRPGCSADVCWRTMRSAGKRPKRIPVEMPSSAVKASTLASRWTSEGGTKPLGQAAMGMCVSPKATTSPAAAPAKESSRLSVRVCRTMRSAVAPSAREQHVSQVHAGDQQNEPNGGEKDEHQRVQVAENRLCERMQGDAMLVIGKLSIDLRLNAG